MLNLKFSMVTGIRHHFLALWRDRDGVAAIVVAIFLPVLVVFTSLVIDMGYSYLNRTQLQHAASAAALAGAGIAKDDGTVANDGTIRYALIDNDGDGVPDNGDENGDGVIDGAVILNEARAYAEKNTANEGILAAVDVLPGHWEPGEPGEPGIFTRAATWDPVTQEFTIDPEAYDTARGTWTAVTDPVVPMNAVMATTRRAADGPNNNPLPLFLASVIGMTEININTTAIATIDVGNPPPLDACITALNRTDEGTIRFGGNPRIEAPGCNIDAYSSDDCAIRAVGTPVISVVDGESVEGDGAVRTANSGGTGTCDTPNVDWFPEEGPTGGLAPPVDIPFGYLYPPGDNCIDGDYCGLVDVDEDGLRPAAPDGGCTGTEPSVEFHSDDYVDGKLYLPRPGDVVNPAVYCGGISIFGPSDSEVIFTGDIVISGGELEVAAKVGISSGVGGVGFYLMDGARINMHGGPGNEGVGLVAQDYGPLKNFVFFEDPNSVLPDSGGDSHHSLRGTPLGAFDGILFFQNSDIEFKGTADALLPLVGDDCTILIADEIYFNGTTQFSADARGCSGDIPPIGLGELTIRLRN